MTQFIDILSPNVVKAKHVDTIPEKLHGRYLLLVNLLHLTSPTLYQAPSYDDYTGSGSYEPLDSSIPAIYVDITDKFVNSQDFLAELMLKAYHEGPKVYLDGTKNFILGKDYYINESLYIYLMNHSVNNISIDNVLPDYYTEDFNIDTKNWEDISNDPYKYYVKLDYYKLKNDILNWRFTEDELNNFYSTFMGIIKDYTLITEETKATGNNPIYAKVIDYYRNFKTDNAATSIALILNSLYGTSSDNTVKCGCNSDLSEATYNTSTCAELYANAMETYLKQMLSDHQFYTDWFMIDTENNVDGVIPNEILIGLLVELIKEFLELEHSLIFKTHTNNNCECPVVDYDEDDCNHKILEQYLKVLGYAVTNTIDANVNKIKVYGGQFAELLPYLIF